jgi:tetratricopeptide (TPR) repeat protein
MEIKRARFDTAVAVGRQAAELLERSGDTTGMAYIGVLNTEANALENQKKRREALAIYDRITSVMDRTGRSQAMARNVIRNNIGIALSNLGEMTDAEPVLRETVATFQRSSPNGFVHPAILINFCRTVLFLQELDTAATWYSRLYKQSVAAKDANMESEGATGMARVELARSRPDEVARWVQLARQAYARRSPPKSNGTDDIEAALAHLRGDLTRASTMFDTTLRRMGYETGKRTYQMRGVLVAAAENALDARQPAKALEYARAAHEIAHSDSLSETRSAYVGEARVLEGRALLASGDTAAARSALAAAVTALRAGVGPTHARTRDAEALLGKGEKGDGTR